MFDINTFYDALPKRRAELIDSRLIVGGSLAKSAMVMASIIRNLNGRTARRFSAAART